MERTFKGFKRLREHNNSMFVTSPLSFKEHGRIDKHVPDSLKWAYDNAYHGHFKNSSRNKFSVMLDAFLGKLGEFAVWEFFQGLGYSLDKPELLVRQRGEWDDGDLVLEGRKIQIKTTTAASNFLLLKRNDWDAEGNYSWGKEGKDPNYGAFFLCRMMPDPRKILTEEKDFETLAAYCGDVSWRYEITGFLTKKDLCYGINNGFFIEKGKMMNGKIPVREDLIYFQAGDLRDPEILPRKQNKDGQ